ncbi:MAG: O-antigen ligase domain-containing protein [Planctomycetota bacterium]|nr:MAG: O-antigen ligase domain-containing protein [Planctomycetota bacterium]
MSWAAVAATGYCLLLTKSRTAWLGVCCALGWRAAVWWRSASGRAMRPAKRSWRLLIAAAVVLGAGIATAVWTGGVDADVIREAPKSLRYRLEYWRGTVRMIADHWFWGVGPGTFQTAYLRYKLPDSSEEIADPHNLFLDAWANGGLAGLCGVLLLMGAMIALGWRLIGGVTDACGEATQPGRSPGAMGTASVEGAAIFGRSADWNRPVMIGVAAGVLGPSVMEWLAGADWNGQRIAVLAGWLGVAVLSRVVSATGRKAGPAPVSARAATAGSTGGFAASAVLPHVATDVRSDGPNPARFPGAVVACVAAFLGVAVHLCGAGGFEMPGFVFTWLLCAVLATAGFPECAEGPGRVCGESPDERRKPQREVPTESRTHAAATGIGARRPTSVVYWTLVVFWCLVGGLGWWYGYRPVRAAEAALAAGDSAWLRGDVTGARRAWLDAARADRFAVEPWLRLAELETARADSAMQRAARLAALEAAEQALREALARDPRRYGTYWELARVLRRRYDALAERAMGGSGEAEAGDARTRWEAAEAAARAALEAYRAGIARYPTQTELLAEYAVFAGSVGAQDQAVSAARRALEYDQRNRRAGHVDRLLPEATVRRLEALLRAKTAEQAH